MRPPDLLRKLFVIAPDFETCWESSHNDAIHEDGSFTLHGICCRFAEFFRQRYELFTQEQLTELFWLVEHYLDDPDEYGLPVANALCTCFLEDIASEPCGEFAKPFMGSQSRSLFDQWHHGPPY